MSVVSTVILNADDELRYPTSGELEGMKAYFETGEQRLRIAAMLAENEKRIVEEASKQLKRQKKGKGKHHCTDKCGSTRAQEEGSLSGYYL